MSPDPIVQNPKDVQAYNRYAYVRNNPMTNIDPSGYSWIGDNKHRIGEAAVYYGMYISLTSGGQPQGLLVGGLTTAVGQHLMGDTRGAAITAFVAIASYGIGNAHAADKLTNGQRIFAHSVVGGTAAELQGDKFHHGALASAASTAFGLNPENHNVFVGTLFSAMIGGTISEVTGGKFKNGAATSALQYIFNDAADHPELNHENLAAEKAKQINALATDVTDAATPSAVAAFFLPVTRAAKWAWGGVTRFGRAVKGAVLPTPKWGFGAHKSETKWANRMKKTKWTEEQITEALQYGKRIEVKNFVNKGNKAYRYIHPDTGRSVVIDHKNKSILQVGGDGFSYTDLDL